MKKILVLFITLIAWIGGVKAETLFQQVFDKVGKLPYGKVLPKDYAVQLLWDSDSRLQFVDAEVWFDGNISQPELQGHLNAVNDILSAIPNDQLTISAFNNFNVFSFYEGEMLDDTNKEVLILWFNTVYGNMSVWRGVMTKETITMLQMGNVSMSYTGTTIHPVSGVIYQFAKQAAGSAR